MHEERSLYHNIMVTEDETRRCMRFTVRLRGGQNQSCEYLGDSTELVFPYVKMMLSSLLLQDRPERVLIVGLGAGTLPEVYHELFPEADIVVSEIDAAVLRVAREWFGFRENERVSVHIGDARVFVKRAGLRKQQFDLVILDAFNGEYIPEHLMTLEFLREVKALLPADGLVVANTFSTSRLYAAESVTYQQAFGEIISLRMRGSINRVVMASVQPLPDRAELAALAPSLELRLAPYGVRITAYPPRMDSRPDWNTAERPLTDQYAPANLLNH